MKQIITAAALAIGILSSAPAYAQSHGHYAGPPSPETLGGAFALTDLSGATVTSESLKGGWTLMFFGYSRCRAACPVALPIITEAARRLRQEGMPVRAAFVDIDQPPLGAPRPRSQTIAAGAADPHAQHAGFEAAKEIGQRFGGSLLVLTGTRGQIRRAIEIYQIRIDHVPPRAGERGHSMNHTTFVYLIGPDGKVAGYLDHASPPEKFVNFVKEKAGSAG